MGNDIDPTNLGYKLHLVYNCLATPSSRGNNSLTSDTDISTFSWDLSTKPEAFPYDRPTSHIYIDSTKVIPAVLIAIENLLYGTTSIGARLPSISEVLSIFEVNAVLKITDHGDGTWTAEGPDEAIQQLDATTFQISWPSVTIIDTYSYTVRSL